VNTKTFPLVALFFVLQVAAFSRWACAQSRNEIHGQVCAAGSLTPIQDQKPIAGIIVKALDADNKVIATAVSRTSAEGTFSIVVPVEIKVYRLIVYDRDANYWVFRPQAEQLNDQHPADLGRILLYPRSKRLTADEANQQYKDAEIIQSIDKVAGELAMNRLVSEYPEMARTDYHHSVGTIPGGPVFYPVLISPPTISDSGGAPKGASESRADLLDKNGPYVDPLYSMSAFATMGYSKGKWPVVVDYLVEQDSLVLLVVSPEGLRPQVYHLPGEKNTIKSR
jgi:hypothetical protein